jgi:peptidoglycan/LPS O-acetylase OafA/YrhL
MLDFPVRIVPRDPSRATTLPARFEPRKLNKSASAHLDMIRGLAAWAVMWGHLRALFFVDFRHLERGSLPLSVLYFFTGFGNQAVMVFFVLSGFLISSAIIGRRVSGDWSWHDYAMDRASRLYVVLIPGLLFGLLWDKMGSLLFEFRHIYSQPIDGFGTAVAQSQLTFDTFLGNLFFLQTILCPTFGSNGPLWSLANEFWYYVLFPVALAAGVAWASPSVRTAIPLTILTACLAVFLGPHILVGFLIWLTGTVLVFANANWRFLAKSRLNLYALATILLLSGCLISARSGRHVILGSDLCVGIAFSLFLFAVLQMDMEKEGSAYPRAAHFLAGFSYSLYVLHFPLLVFLRAWLVPPQRWQPDVLHLTYGVFLGMAILGFASLVSVFTERNTRAARSWMKRMIPASLPTETDS